jgi:hypothetical protein
MGRRMLSSEGCMRTFGSGVMQEDQPQINNSSVKVIDGRRDA